MRPRTIQLRPLRSDAERDRYHAIRAKEIFELYHRADGPNPCRYEPDHPDEDDPANHPLVLVADGTVAGTIRIDLKPDGRAVLRLVAVAPEWRGTGLGAELLVQAEAYAARLGARSLSVNAQSASVGFYARGGFIPGAWPGSTRCLAAVPMVKPMGGLPLHRHAAPARCWAQAA